MCRISLLVFHFFLFFFFPLGTISIPLNKVLPVPLKQSIGMFDHKTKDDFPYATVDLSSPDAGVGVPNLRRLRSTDGLRTALTLTGLCAGIIVSYISTRTLSVYRATYEPDEYLQPLWPDDLDLRPTFAFIIGGVMVAIANAISVLADRISFVSLSSPEQQHRQKCVHPQAMVRCIITERWSSFRRCARAAFSAHRS